MAETITNINQLDSKVWTQNNLLAGKNIEIVEKINPYVIDNHVTDLYHFDGNYISAVETTGTITIASDAPQTTNSNYFKFGNGSANLFSRTNRATNVKAGKNIAGNNHDCTVDFWLMLQETNWGLANPAMYFYQMNNYISLYWNGRQNQFELTGYQSVGSAPTGTWKPDVSWYQDGKFHHIAFCFTVETKTLDIFFDGVKRLSFTSQVQAMSATENRIFSFFGDANQTISSVYVDELRISDVVRWTEDFEVPTEAYTKTSNTSQYLINNTSSSGTLTTTWFKNNTGTTLDTSISNIQEVYKNGLLLEPGQENDYTLNGTVITFTDALITSDKIAVKA